MYINIYYVCANGLAYYFFFLLGKPIMMYSFNVTFFNAIK